MPKIMKGRTVGWIRKETMRREGRLTKSEFLSIVKEPSESWEASLGEARWRLRKGNDTLRLTTLQLQTRSLSVAVGKPGAL